ncbi:hypothetical protein KR093_002643 [Drosophila rubida]|uniref:Uncharacterized protein n=1 Tax=Drosophila rubida TaxID=30044 RepID=A0AAD4PNU6_9MUSC|nr:hypothetical protein KR093_002643 [Drosophila rubida]
MFNSIEIPDSDDDAPETIIPERTKSVISGTESNDTTPKKQNESSDASSSKSPESLSSREAKVQNRHRARKTQHTVRNGVENEIQFESIPLDETESSSSPQSKVPKIDVDDNIKSVIDNMLDSQEVQEIIQQIADERVRCNFLLATYQVKTNLQYLRIYCKHWLLQLPDMSFRLNTDLGILKYQFRERLKKHKMENNTATGTTKATVNQSNVSKTTSTVSNVTTKTK